ncbi:hypothetical protein [Thiobaca trueperi]|uniref:hypothetical protein n=1 Tax=Thiobaca trueperi TaxID=127458 RepID=UPI001046E473|nr:hypothetical protein [Thiobaca trueperi]
MPEKSIWALIVSLILYAIGTTLKIAETSHLLKLANDEVARLRKQLEVAQDEINKGAGQDRHANSSLLFGDHLKTLLFDENTGTWIGLDSLRYCPRCQSSNISSPLKNEAYGWKCAVCNYYAADPDRPIPRDRNPGSWIAGKARIIR